MWNKAVREGDVAPGKKKSARPPPAARRHAGGELWLAVKPELLFSLGRSGMEAGRIERRMAASVPAPPLQPICRRGVPFMEPLESGPATASG
jgi:hypothetical protein